MIFSLDKISFLSFRKTTINTKYQKNLVIYLNKLKSDFSVFSMGSSFFLIAGILIPNNLYFFLKLQNYFFEKRNFIIQINNEIEYLLTLHPIIFPKLFFLDFGIFRCFRQVRKTFEIIHNFRKKFRQETKKTDDVCFQKKLGEKIFQQPLYSIKKSKLKKSRDIKKEKKKLIQQDLNILKDTVEKDLTNLNKKLETNIIKQIYNIDQINDDSKKNLFYFNKIRNIVKKKLNRNATLAKNFFFTISLFFLVYILLNK